MFSSIAVSLFPEVFVAVGLADGLAEGQHGRVRRHHVDWQLVRRRLLAEGLIVLDDVDAVRREARVGEAQRHIVGADAAACIKSTCYNMTKSGYTVHVLSDCITSYDKKKLPELLAYYESKGCSVILLQEVMGK